MNKRLIFYVALVACATVSLSHAGQGTVAASSEVAAQATPQKVRIPTTDYEVTIGTRKEAPRGAQPSQELLKAIVTWLSNDFGLPRDYSYPAISFEPTRITALRRSGPLSVSPKDMSAVRRGQREVIATYDPSTQTIFLPEGWNGSTPAELSILVHEMVHHLQNVARLKYECVQASEELAYAAQNKWLGLFGRDLATDFRIDAFTLLVRTRCMY